MTASDQGGTEREPALDPAELLRLKRELGPNAVRVAEVFLKVAPKRLTAVDEAHKARDGQGLKRAAHTLKGSASQVGALPLIRLCKELESAALAEAWTEVAVLLDAVREEAHRAVWALTAWSGEEA